MRKVADNTTAFIFTSKSIGTTKKVERGIEREKERERIKNNEQSRRKRIEFVQ